MSDHLFGAFAIWFHFGVSVVEWAHALTHDTHTLEHGYVCAELFCVGFLFHIRLKLLVLRFPFCVSRQREPAQYIYKLYIIQIKTKKTLQTATKSIAQIRHTTIYTTNTCYALYVLCSSLMGIYVRINCLNVFSSYWNWPVWIFGT